MFSSTLPAVRHDLLIRGNVSHVVHFALLALVHGLVGLLVPPAETETSSEPGWRSGQNTGQKKRQINKLIDNIQKKKKKSVRVSMRVNDSA